MVAAWRELAAQGWVTTRPGGRTVVAPTLPVPIPRPSAVQRAPFAVEAHPRQRDGLASRWPLGAGEPDLRLLPAAALARAMRRALHRGRPSVLGYRDGRGLPEYLDGVRDWLGATRGVATDRSRLVSTHGAQHALDLVTRALVRPGDRVAVEALGYAPAWRVFDLAGARRVVLPVDGEGVRIDALERALAEGPIRAVYVTPHHQYPTTVTLSPARRVALANLARAHHFAIVEDDYDHEFHYDGPPRLPLAANDPDGHVVYIGTFSKVLAPGLRLGFVHAAPELADALVELRQASDRQGDGVTERAVAELLHDGDLQRHVRKVRRIYAGRRDHLAHRLQEQLPDVLSFTVPSGGIGLWATVAEEVDDEAWVAAARQVGIGLRAGREFSAEGSRVRGLRLVFSRLDEDELGAAVEALARVVPRDA